jgi:hypothetical protein
LSLKGPFQGKAFLFPLRGNYLSPGQLNINEERRKKNGCTFCWEENQRKRTREGFKPAEEAFRNMKTRNCMISDAMNVSPASLNFNISGKT